MSRRFLHFLAGGAPYWCDPSLAEHADIV